MHTTAQSAGVMFPMSRPRSWFPLATQLAVLVVCSVILGVLPYALAAFCGLQTDPRKTQGEWFYPWNFAPLGAASLYAAMKLKDWRWAVLFPIGVKLLIDVSIFAVTQDHTLALYPYQLVVYLSAIAFAVMGMRLQRQDSSFYVGGKPALSESVLRIGGAGFIAELLFFVLSNFGAWLMYDTYPHTPAGLLQCYIAAVPFFGRSLVSMFLYSGMIFGGFAYLENRQPAVVGQSVQHVE